MNMKVITLILALLLVVGLMATACGGGDNADSTGTAGTSSMNMDIPEDLDTSTSKESDGGLFEVTVTSSMDPLAINAIHSWTVHIEDREGNGVEGAAINVDGGMPQHNHGFPTEPQITGELGAGDYMLEGVKFNMTGWWELMLEISSGSVTDTVAFNIILIEQMLILLDYRIIAYAL